MNISILFREAYGKKSSGNRLGITFFRKIRSLVETMKLSNGVFVLFFKSILRKWSTMDLAFREACGKKVQKACKKHHLLKNKNSEKLRLFGHFGILPKEKTPLFSVDFRKPFQKIPNIFHTFFT